MIRKLKQNNIMIKDSIQYRYMWESFHSHTNICMLKYKITEMYSLGTGGSGFHSHTNMCILKCKITEMYM